MTESMTDSLDIPPMPGYIPIKEAAHMIGLDEKTIYRYVKDRRLPAVRAGRTIMLSIDEVQKFRLAPPGRVSGKAHKWRKPSGRVKFFATSIQVKIRPEMRQKLHEKLLAMDDEKHTFSRNVARYIMEHTESGMVEILLIWKDTETPDEATQQRDILHFKRDFPELDWDTAHYCNHNIYRLT